MAGTEGMKIKITKDGPYMVTGGVPLEDRIMRSEDGGHHRFYEPGAALEQKGSYALCRCGHSKTMPFCDGTHAKVNFDGTEVADRTPYDDRSDLEAFEGGMLKLTDDGRCAFARFCHRKGGDVWTLTEEAADADTKSEAIAAANECPAGRLVQHDKENGNAEIEPELEPKIAILQDPEKQSSGPIAVEGGIPLESADGTMYETRNRYALCRCGGSRNKPFCDAMHVTLGFEDMIDKELWSS
jgi:CDGSH-type Zn-finger protein